MNHQERLKREWAVATFAQVRKSLMITTLCFTYLLFEASLQSSNVLYHHPEIMEIKTRFIRHFHCKTALVHQLVLMALRINISASLLAINQTFPSDVIVKELSCYYHLILSCYGKRISQIGLSQIDLIFAYSLYFQFTFMISLTQLVRRRSLNLQNLCLRKQKVFPFCVLILSNISLRAVCLFYHHYYSWI